MRVRVRVFVYACRDMLYLWRNMSLKTSILSHDSRQEELKEHEKMKEELLKTWEAETKALKQQHEDQVALLLAQHQHEVRVFLQAGS